MSEDISEARTNEFIERFAPPEAGEEWGYNHHARLSDSKHKYRFTPTAAQLEECLKAYLNLLEEATSEHITGILSHHNFMATSELVLAYLVRAEAAQTLFISRDTRNRLAALTERMVLELRSFMGGSFDGDAVNRVASINAYLKAAALSNRDRDVVLEAKDTLASEE